MEKAKQDFLNLLDKLDPSDQEQFLKWTQTFSRLATNDDESCYKYASEEEKRRERKGEVLLSCIKESLRNNVPFSGVMKSEKVNYPKFGEDKHLNDSNCLHVDAFLYDDDEVDALVDEGKIRNQYCSQCNSSDICPKTFVSHSASKERMKHIFRSCLPPLKGKTVLDVGSRLGVVLYVAYTCTDAEHIIGVELNSELCALQQSIVDKYKLNERIRVRQGDVMDMEDEVKAADVLVLMNVFEWFLDRQQQNTVWNYLQRCIKSGTLIVASPPIDVSLKLIKSKIDIGSWLKKLDTENQMDTDFVEETEFCIYEVK